MNFICKLVEADANVTKWFVKTGKPGFEFPSECEFGPIIGKYYEVMLNQ